MSVEDYQQRTDERIQKCAELGLRFDFISKSYVYDDINIPLIEVKALGASEWEELITGIEAEMIRRKNI